MVVHQYGIGERTCAVTRPEMPPPTTTQSRREPSLAARAVGAESIRGRSAMDAVAESDDRDMARDRSMHIEACSRKVPLTTSVLRCS